MHAPVLMSVVCAITRHMPDDNFAVMYTRRAIADGDARALLAMLEEIPEELFGRNGLTFGLQKDSNSSHTKTHP